MTITNSVVAIFDTHEQAEQAIKELQEAGVDMKSLSIAGRDTHTDEILGLGGSILGRVLGIALWFRGIRNSRDWADPCGRTAGWMDHRGS